MALIPAERLTDWTPGTYTGVPGGIPTDRTNIIDVTLAPYFADNTGATDASAAIQDAIDAAVAEDIIYFPTGEYRLDTTLNITHTKDSITFRGDGPALTKLKPQSGAGGFAWGSGDGWNWPFPPQTVTSGLSQNSTSITLADATEFPVGALIRISFDDMVDDADIQAGAAPTFGVGGSNPDDGLRKQVSRVTAKVGNVLTIFPGIYHEPFPGLGAKVAVAQLQLNFVGVEDMWIDMTDSTAVHPMYMQHAYGNWILNVKISNISNYGVTLYDSLQCEVRRCELGPRKSGGSNGAALLVNTTCGGLYEDNVLYDAFPIIEVNAGSSGNAITYNLAENPPGEFGILFAIDSNHGPHNSHNLYEGNITPNIICDGYFGSCSEDTLFRNWMHGSCVDDSATTFTMALKRFTRNYSLVGNVVGKQSVAQGSFSYGQPNIGNGDSIGTAEPDPSGDFWVDWGSTAELTTRTSDTAGEITLNSGSFLNGQLGTVRWGGGANYQTFTVTGVAGNVVTWSGGLGVNLPAQGTEVQVYMQPAGYQELDLNVESTTIDKGNYLYGVGGGSGSMSSLEGDPLPDSLLYASEPDWWNGALLWPPFDPESPDDAEYSATPAGLRFLEEETSGDILVVTQVANAAPVTELWLRGALTSGVAAAPSYYLVQHSGPYPTQPDNNFVYQRFGTPQDHVYVFQGTVTEAEAVASVP